MTATALLSNDPAAGGLVRARSPAEVAASARPPATPSPLNTAKIAIVDDEPINIKVVRKHLQNAGYVNFVTTSDSTTASAMLAKETPDVVLLDVMMPQVDGIQILQAVRADPHLRYTPVLILTASTDAETKSRALNAGATDFLAKPVDPSDLIPRLRNALIVKAHHDHLASYSEQLEREVRLRTAEVEVSRLQVIHCLARAGEYRDDSTGRHVVRVSQYATILARQLGLADLDAQMLGLAALLHDVGKIGLPDAILLKDGPLGPDEYAIVQKHCDIGQAIIEPQHAGRFGAPDECVVNPLIETCTQYPLLGTAARIAYSHHERWDGRGYPRGLAREQIPLEGRITAVADVFDALSCKRPYKPAYPLAKCFEILEQGRATQFDPTVLDALSQKKDEIISIYHRHAE